MVVGVGHLLTFLGAASPLAMQSRPKQSNGRRPNGGTDETSISACDSDHSGRRLGDVRRRLRLRRPYHDQPQRAHRAWRGIRQGRDAAGRLQGRRDRLPAWLVQDPWRRLSAAGPVPAISRGPMSCIRRSSSCARRIGRRTGTIGLITVLRTTARRTSRVPANARSRPAFPASRPGFLQIDRLHPIRHEGMP